MDPGRIVSGGPPPDGIPPTVEPTFEATEVEVARAAAISPETLRKIETGRLATPAFTTVAALAQVLDVPLDNPARLCLVP